MPVSVATRMLSKTYAARNSWLYNVLVHPGMIADAFFVAVLVGLAVMRWKLLIRAAYPPGIDPGNWLAFGHAIAGEHIRSSSIVYPPVVPLLTLAASKAFGSLLGIQVLAEAASAIPAIGAYVVFRRTIGGWNAAI